jgi:PAN domain
MQRLQSVWVLCAAIISTTFVLAAPALAGENKFVFVPQSDSPGNDYLRVDNSSFEDCSRRCDAQSACNAFTYNRLRGVCFLKRSANASTTFYASATTGIKLSPSELALPPTHTGNPGAYFIIIPRADSPGNDYFKITLFTVEECQHSCEADKECNAFTYNQAKSACFLKRATTQWINFYAFATTGIKLATSPSAQ